MKENISLKDLINRCLNNDSKAQSLLMNFFWYDVKSYVLSIIKEDSDAEDVTIEIFTKVFNKLNLYNNDFDFKKWLISIAHNNSIDFIRKNKSRIQVDFEQNLEYYFDFEPSTEDLIIQKQGSNYLITLIENLEDKYKTILKLKYIDELSIKEIALKLNLSISNAKVRLMRARNLLEKIKNINM